MLVQDCFGFHLNDFSDKIGILWKSVGIKLIYNVYNAIPNTCDTASIEFAYDLLSTLHSVWSACKLLFFFLWISVKFKLYSPRK